jgi:hypothetical protein
MSPLFDWKCEICGNVTERWVPASGTPFICCGKPAEKLFPSSFLIKTGYPIWIDRMDDIHKAQADKGQKLRYVHPKEIRAT